MKDRSQGGFVLVSTIWLTLIMLFFAGMFSFYASVQLERGIESKLRVSQALDQFSTEQTFLYLFSTNEANRRGLRVDSGADGVELVALDGSRYQGLGRITFAAIDYAGLVGLNSADNFHLVALLSEFEASGIREDELIEALYDYIDLDDFPRMNGGEASAYRIAKLSKPTNDYLRSPQEIRAVLGWDAWLQENPGFKIDWLSTNWRSRINLNALPVELFDHVLGLADSETERLMNRRAERPFENMDDVLSILNYSQDLDDDRFVFLPSERIRLRLYSESNSNISSIAVRFTPLGQSSPWKIEYRYETESTTDSGEPARIVARRYFSRELSSAN